MRGFDGGAMSSGDTILGIASGGDGRVYLIVVKATDAAGNVSYSVETVVVPPSRSAGDLAIVNAQASAARAYFLANLAQPPGYFMIGDGPVTGPKQ